MLIDNVPEVFGLNENYMGYYVIREIRHIGDSSGDPPAK